MADRVVGMQVLIRVAKAGSFSAAARALKMSPTMVTKHVTELEHRLGATLFYRSTRRLTLTEAGTRFLESSQQILSDIEEAEANAVGDRVEARGTLRLQVPISFGMRWIGPLLPEFLREHPQVTIEVGAADHYVDLIEESCDLAIRVGRMPDSTLTARKLAPARAVVCAAPTYLAERGTPTRIKDLSKHNCLSYSLARTIGVTHWPFAQGEAGVEVTGNLRADSGEILLAAARAGLGLIYEPTFIVADDLRSGRLVILPLDRPPIELGGVYAVYPSRRYVPQKVRALIAFLSERLVHPPWEQGLPFERTSIAKPR